MRRRIQYGENHENGGWHLSLAALVLILLAFFTLMFAFEKSNLPGFMREPAQDEAGMGISVGDDSFLELFLRLQNYLSDNNLDGHITLMHSKDYVFIAFLDGFMFERGDEYITSRLNARELEILNFMGQSIKGTEDEDCMVYVIGNTGETDRPSAILAYLEHEIGIESEKLLLLAFGTRQNSLADSVEILLTREPAIHAQIVRIYYSRLT